MLSRTLVLGLALLAVASEDTSELPAVKKVRRNKRSCTARSSNFTLTDKFQGTNFFDDWDFFTESDPTHGLVNYLGASDALNAGLISTTASQATMKVDDTTSLASGQRRSSVRISTKKSFDSGLIILDIDAMPHGCAIWPAFWTVGPNWPNGGEIDIIESVNDATNNQMTLHTGAGCTQSNNNAILGQVLTTTCDANVNENSGCGIHDPSSTSSGAGLAQAGGAVFATILDESGVKIWRFDRSNVPADINNGNPSPGTWGPPVAQWSSGTCNPSQFIVEQQIVFDITLCGDWAGSVYGSSGCPGTCQSQVMDPNNFKTGAWVVNYVAVYSESS
ncbi:glycoside hydrolase family 16 protein [Dacryopinax primogenitus]|uniref:Glycoside hydrolase family 16 protein n=1 Tax=Dacryopinax primogenitus (strain DJM 731) TaxID=1858805 RepID=M5GC73_DACPD|nr:glycoside hydrolase family 16 protein [Dacryopinax primogenitus]EJU03692.1 glycoside hydrolase family 16 protein [Dacryopinax primogenitus]